MLRLQMISSVSILCLVLVNATAGTSEAAAAAASDKIEVLLNFNPQKPENESAVWLAYLAARAGFINDHRDSYRQQTGIVTPLYEEEVTARTAVVVIYRELQSGDKTLKSAYFDDLGRIAASGFMREYVWIYLHQSSWGDAPKDLKLTDFEAWRIANLANHQATTKGSIAFKEKSTAQAKTADPNDAAARLAKGREVLQKGNPQQAIIQYFDPVIDQFTQALKGTSKHLYSAQNQRQAIMYTALPDDKNQGIEVLDGAWANAYLLKAYGLTELGKLNEAQIALNAAIQLSPLNSQYRAELAYTYQAQKDCDKSIATYAEAASIAEMGSDEQTKTTDLTRAWRGEGYCLVEQGKLGQAEAMYRKSLALDPNDAKSKGELDYIRGLRK